MSIYRYLFIWTEMRRRQSYLGIFNWYTFMAPSVIHSKWRLAQQRNYICVRINASFSKPRLSKLGYSSLANATTVLRKTILTQTIKKIEIKRICSVTYNTASLSFRSIFKEKGSFTKSTLYFGSEAFDVAFGMETGTSYLLLLES